MQAGNAQHRPQATKRKTGKDGTDEQTGVASGCGCGAGKSGEHGVDESEGGTQENRAAELGEELVDDGADTCAEQGCRLAHAVADDGGDEDGSCQNRQDLLESEQQHLAELGLVVNTVDQIHCMTSIDFLS